MTEYLKGKDIKTKGDCLVYYWIKKIEYILDNTPSGRVLMHNIPEDFDKW